MAEVTRGNLEAPDEVISFPKITAKLVELGDLTVGDRGTHELKDLEGEWKLAPFVG